MYAQQSSIDPSLAALLQTAQMVTPDQTPTVAAQVAQAAAQKLMPRQPAPGIQALMPGVRQQAMNAAQAMQPVTQGQLAQMQARPPMQAGIGGLPGDIATQGMAEGGVVGYAGETDGSYVVPRTYGYAPDYEEAQKYGIVLSPYDSPEVRQEKLERVRIARETGELPPPGEKESASSKDAEGIMKALKFVASPVAALGAAAADVAGLPINLLRKYSLPGVSKGDESLTPVMDMLRRQVPAKSSGRGEINPPMAASEEGQKLAERMSAPTAFNFQGPKDQWLIDTLRAQANKVGGREREDLLAQIAQMQAQVPPRPPEAAPAAPAAPTGIAQNLPMSIQEVGNQARQVVGEMDPRIAQEMEKANQLRRAIPPSGIETLEAIRRAQQADKEANELANQRAQSEGLTRWLMGRASEAPAGAARSYSAFEQEEAGRKKAFADLQIARAKEADAITRVNAAKESGDQDALVKALMEYNAAKEKRDQVTATLTGNIYTAQTHAAAQAQLKQLPPFEQQMATRFIEDWMKANPGKTFVDAWDAWKSSGKGFDERNEAKQAQLALARQKLLDSDMLYSQMRMTYINATDPEKKAEAFRKMKEIERLHGIVDEAGQASPTQLPPGVTVKRVGP